MSITTTRTQELVKEYSQGKDDTGSTHVQVAILTERIRNITEHLKVNKKDYASQRGLMKLVGRRQTLLRYLRNKSFDAYKDLIQSLGLRK